MACGNRTPLLVCFLACATFKRFGLSPMVRWFNMLVHTVFPCKVTAGGVKIQHIPDLTNKCLSVCSVRNTPPVCITDTSVLITSVLSPLRVAASHFLAVIFQSVCVCVHLLLLCSKHGAICPTQIPNDPQPFWFQYHGPVVSRWSFDHSFSPAPY